MKLVLDNNIFFSLMNPDSVASYISSTIDIEFFAPEYIKQELEEHKEECLFKSKLSEHEFEIRQTEVESRIKFFKESGYDGELIKAITNLSDPKDSPYLALALSIDASIWSNDTHLINQSLVNTYKTEDLFNMMLNKEI
ncbi:MAG: PIN domain-containing protein [Nanoarchaeota archaeon]|nr:PIN domain-containing protein [Nanoarchaeota archaeon]